MGQNKTQTYETNGKAIAKKQKEIYIYIEREREETGDNENQKLRE